MNIYEITVLQYGAARTFREQAYDIASAIMQTGASNDVITARLIGSADVIDNTPQAGQVL